MLNLKLIFSVLLPLVAAFIYFPLSAFAVNKLVGMPAGAPAGVSAGVR